MLLRVTIITLLLVVYIQYVEGIERVIIVSESNNVTESRKTVPNHT